MNNLKHFGVLGMKWGVRRNTASNSSEHVRVASLKRKRISEMSNEELQSVATRMQLERTYKDLNPDKLTRGTKAVDRTLTNIGKFTTAVTTITTAITVGKKLFEIYKKHRLGG